jgi:Protein of unknown function (DUF1524)
LLRIRPKSAVALASVSVVVGLVLTSPDDPRIEHLPQPLVPAVAPEARAPARAASPSVPTAATTAAVPVDVPVVSPSSGVRGADRVEVARQHLLRLPMTTRARPNDYERDRFGSSWVDTDGNGCNQRDDVLRRDAVRGSVSVAADGCDVLAGEWIDPYTGRRHVLEDIKEPAQAQAVQIDHVVPLSEAWASGARDWDDDKRRVFANDLDALRAADGPTNASKGDSDPAAWRPRKGFQCRYAELWIGIKARWDLAVDPSEVAALEEMLGFCA